MIANYILFIITCFIYKIYGIIDEPISIFYKFIIFQNIYLILAILYFYFIYKIKYNFIYKIKSLL